MAVGLLLSSERASSLPVPQFQNLFNGKNLKGWVNVNTDKDTGSVRKGELVCSGKPIGVMRSEKEDENFILHIEWKHIEPGGNSGVYVHGELFGVGGVQTVPDNPRGPRSKSIENRCKGRDEWNTYDVVAVDGVIKLSVNGKFVNGISRSTKKKGYLCLESEGAEIHFGNIQIMELPSSASGEEQISPRTF